VPPDSTSASAPTTADRITVLVLVLVSASTTATALARPLSSLGRAGLLALAFAALGLATGVGWWRHALGMRTVLIVTLALLVVAVTYWPRNSTDVWSYAAYGRMVSHYGASPYRHVPVEYSNDRAIRRVKPMWQNTSSVYGPLWNGISAGVVSVTGTHLQSTRMWFQALAALSVFLAALLIARRTRAPAAVALIGLNPLVIYDIVNGGHNDALVGLALLAGVILATRERFVLAALVIALGALIKLVALLGLVALVVWIWRKRGPRPAAVSAAVAGGVVATGYALSGGLDALKPLREARLQMSRNSIWLLSGSDGRTKLFGLDRVQLGTDFLRPAATLSMVAVPSSRGS
jgi:alpha-1,6-mannosyltransferase